MDRAVTTVKGRIVTPTGVIDGCVALAGGRIVDVGPEARGGGEAYDFGPSLVVPGFIDVHMHGLGRHDVFEAADLVEVARLQATFGTTGFLPSVASLSMERYLEFGQNVRKAREAAGPEAARILGAHFEGPFINPEAKAGMDAAYLRPVDLGECQTYLDEAGDVLKLMTLSPELPGAVELIKLLRKQGVVASLGHSRAGKRELEAAMQAGLNHVCHLFNAFEHAPMHAGWQHPPNLAISILAGDRLNCEVVCDMFHVVPEYVRLAAKALGPDRFLAITDSLPGAGLEPGEYTMIDGREFTTREGVARLTSDGTVVGSVITLNRGFANLIQRCGIDPVTAARYTSTNAARALGLAERLGSIESGKQADLAVLDADYRCVATFLAGQMVYGT